MERQRRAAQEAQAAAAAAALHAALAALQHRGPPVRELPAAPAAWARPSVKAMQAALYLLHHRIRGAARTKKELQHVYPVLEPAQAREFKAAMQGWVGELAAGSAISPDAAKYFPSAYQGSAAHRSVLLLLDLSAMALAKELGGSAGPLASLPDADLLQPAHGGGAGLAPPPPLRAAQAATAAQRQLQARLDSVVAAMQRLKQLMQQAGGQLAAGQAASGGCAAALAPRVPPLFAGSQAAAKRGELVAELLAHGPPLTGQPEVVGPDSWADLLAAGKGPAAAGGSAAASAAAAPPATARRLSNPAQEAYNFAAEGLAADADVLTVHAVLVQRLAAVGAALQAAIAAGAAPGSAEVQGLLAEAAAYRESLMLSVRQELAAAAIRAEQQQDTICSGSSRAPMLQLLPPSLPPRNPVTEGLHAAQQQAQQAATDAATSSSSGWEPPLPDAVEALRHAMWQRLQSGSSSSSSSGSEPAGSPAAADDAAAAAAASPCSPEAEATPPPDSPAQQGAGAAAGSSSSKPARARLPAAAVDSPNLEAMLSVSTGGLNALQLLDDLPDDCMGSPQQQQSWQQPWQPSGRQPPESPCMAESCASASMMGDSGGGGAASRRQAHGSRAWPLLPLASPTLSAAASFMPHPQPPRFASQQSQQQQQQQPSSSSLSPQQPAVAPAAPSPPLRLLDISPLASSPALQRLASSGGLDAGSPLARAGSWRHAEAAAAGDAASPAPGSSGSRRRRAASITTFTPPRCLDSPQPEQPQQEQQPPPSPATAAAGGGSDATPVSKLLSSGSPLHARTPVPSPALQPVQQRWQEQRQLWQQASGAGGGSPGSPLLASCLKSKPAELAQSPFALATLQSPAGEPQELQPASPCWAITAARSGGSDGGSLGSPRGSAGRRRSTVITTSSPLGPPRSLDATPPPASRLAGGGAAGAAAAQPAAAAAAAAVASPAVTVDELLSGPKRFDSPAVSSLSSRSAQAAPEDGGAMDALRQRLARIALSHK